VGRITMPDYCLLCGNETRWGTPIYLEGSDEDIEEFVCNRCERWAAGEEADLDELCREQIGDF
jgi:hypothetical protein